MADGSTFDPVAKAVRVIEVNSAGTGNTPPAASNTTTGTVTSVPDAASNTPILAANTARKGATFYNDSTELCYLLVGSGTPSATVFTVPLLAGGFYELPIWPAGVYTGAVRGIWANDASGSMRITEYT